VYIDPLAVQAAVLKVDTIVGDGSDATHSDLQAAIDDTPNGGTILIKKVCTVDTTIHTDLKALNLSFQGSGTGLTAGLATTGIRFDVAGCVMKGFGIITGFTTAVDLNISLTRIEMVFSGNTTNIDIALGLNSEQINYQGSYGLDENSQIETSNIDGSIARWDDSKKRWEPVTGLTADSSGNLTGVTLIGAVYQ
jgi:hypothetical protein